MKNIFPLTIFIVAVTGTLAAPAYTGDASFSQDDRDRFIRFETKLDVGFQQIDKRFELIDKRFEQIDKRFEHVDKRFEQIEKRFEQVDKRFEELREDVNKRFEELRDDMNKRFEQIMTFLWMLTGIFTTLTIGVIGFAYWDRRTIIKKAKEETIDEIEGEGRVKDLINALREISRSNSEVARVLRQFHIL